MPSLVDRVSRFARSPKGRQLMRQAQAFAKKPENRRKIADFRSRLARR
jgi:hypothetical protein